jgi:hypothetical protein
MVLLLTMPTLLRNFLLIHFHGAGLGGADGSSPDLTPLDFYIWGYVKQILSTVFVFTTFNTGNRESGKLLHMSVQMFSVGCGRKWNTA